MSRDQDRPRGDVRLRVAQWATGNVGRQSLRAIIAHPGLELAAVIVSDPAKAGRDAAELCGLTEPTGVFASLDSRAIRDAGVDVVAYNAVGTAGRNEAGAGPRSDQVVADICGLLEAGVNVVSTSLIPMIHPASAAPDQRAALQAACRTGGTSCFTSGLEPGFMDDVLPLLVSGLCLRIDQIKVSEVMCYGRWDKPEALTGKFGFGKPLDHRPPILQPGVLTTMWGTMARLLADRLGLALDRVEEGYELLPAPETFVIPAGAIPAGSSAGMRFWVSGIVGGCEAIVIEHVTRLREQDAPHWPKAPLDGAGGYRIEISGEPPWTLEIGSPAAGEVTAAGTLATALRCVNAIPAVCAAPPGLLTPFDLPLITGRGLVRTAD